MYGIFAAYRRVLPATPIGLPEWITLIEKEGGELSAFAAQQLRGILHG